MRAIALAVGLALAAGPGWGFPAFFNGNDLWEYCTTDKSFLHGFAAGAVDTYSLTTTSRPSLSWAKLCIPDGVISTQLPDIVCNYLRDKPEQRHLAATSLTWSAVSAAFPCSAQ